MAGAAGFEPAYRCLTNNFITSYDKPQLNSINPSWISPWQLEHTNIPENNNYFPKAPMLRFERRNQL